ncbi:MAG: SPASM domain-containing protein [Candidatus Dormibacteraeota bacterium]|nr:SPASM domain-containing protein [Candidatus Dormibacteraeota bacterium]
MCLVSYRPEIGRRQGALDLALFRDLIEENPQLERVTLQGLGEPLLAPDLPEMVRLASARGVDMGFNTNGMLLTERRAEELVRAGLGWLHVSLDGARAETYAAIRGRGDLARVETNVRRLVEVRRRLGAERPRLSLVLVAMRRNLDEIPQVVRLAAEWGVGRLWVQNLSHSFSDTDPSGDYRGIRDFAEEEALWSGDDLERADRTFATARGEARRLGVELRLPRLREAPRVADAARSKPACDWPWRSAYVTHEGVVQPCCMVMGSDRVRLGDLRRRRFSEVWSSETYAAFRRGLTGESAPHPVCAGCSVYHGVF